MLPLNLNRKHLEGFLDALHKGKAIPVDHTWDVDRVLCLASACLYTIYRQGPKDEQYYKDQGMDASHPSDQHAELANGQFSAELFAALEFCTDLAGRIFDGSYDNLFEERIGALFKAKPDGEVGMRKIMGFKGPVG